MMRSMRRRSREIPACVLLMAAAVGCRERRDCVDAAGHKVPDTYCSSGHGGSAAHYVYGGRGGRSVGDTVTDGSVTRGGFGGGEGDGGGHGGGSGE